MPLPFYQVLVECEFEGEVCFEMWDQRKLETIKVIKLDDVLRFKCCKWVNLSLEFLQTLNSTLNSLRRFIKILINFHVSA